MSSGLRRLFAALPHVPAHAGAPGTGDEDDRSLLALIVETHRDITAAAVANAVYNATGVRHRDLPITPARILGG